MDDCLIFIGIFPSEEISRQKGGKFNMPNWCDTQYCILGPRKEICSLKKHIEEFTSKEFSPSDFKEKWLGNIAIGAGLDWEKIPCRGTLDRIDAWYPRNKDDAELQIDTTSAWSPTEELFFKVAAKYAPHCKVYYLAVEPGVELYMTNDAAKTVFTEEFYVDSHFATADSDLEKALRNFFGDGLTSWRRDELGDVLDEIRDMLFSSKDIDSNDYEIEDLIQRIERAEESWPEGNFLNFHHVEVNYDEIF